MLQYDRTHYERLTQDFDALPIIDTHEHLGQESERLKQNVSFTDLFYHYCIDDFVAAGMSDADAKAMYDEKTPLPDKWGYFSRYYPLVKNGSYCRAGALAMKRFYGMDDVVCYEDAVAVTERMRANNTPGIYGRVLKDACHFQKSLNFCERFDDPLFEFVPFMNHFVEICSMADLQNILHYIGLHPTLTNYIAAIKAYMNGIVHRGHVGVKFSLAYTRDLRFEMPTTAEAETVYNRIYNEAQGWRNAVLGYEEARPLQDYIVNHICMYAGEINLPVVFHTGIQTGTGNRIDNARPERLWSLFNRCRNTPFVLLHAGLPWYNECITLAKYFPNVYVDMAWVHAISPVIAQQCICSAVDLIPRNKLFGFGGDYFVIEPIYGHLMLARHNIAAALAARIADGAMSLDDALAWQKAMLYDNPAAVYNL